MQYRTQVVGQHTVRAVSTEQGQKEIGTVYEVVELGAENS